MSKIKTSTYSIPLAVFSLFLLLSVSTSYADGNVATAAEVDANCKDTVKVAELDSALASASTWANLSGSADSIKTLSSTMLGAAENKSTSLQAPTDACPSGCNVLPKPEIKFSWIPNKLLSDYSDVEHCKKKLSETSAKPLQYSGLVFPTLDDLAAWFSDFSQGKGKLGNDLYEKCDGSCSPQYRSVIEKKADGFVINLEVVCGHARDKSDDHYQLASALQWSCAPSSVK